VIAQLRAALLVQRAVFRSTKFASTQLSMLASLFAVALAIGCAPREKAPVVVGDGRVEIGAVVPAYAAQSVNGDSVSLEALRGTVTLLNIWATWCLPCRAEIPELRNLHARYQRQGLALIGVSVDADGTNDLIQKFMRDFQMTFPVWHDPEERILTTFRTIGVPSTFLIDKKGVLRWRTTGPIAPGDSSLKQAIERALSS